jgi:uncharacterized damage-inducible protein DinB
MIASTADFIKYFESVRRRTLNYMRVVPAERLEWAPEAGEFTCAEVIRHIMVSERMFVRVVTEGRWHYDGHETTEPQNLDDLIALLDASHSEAIGKLKRFPDQELTNPCPGPKGEGRPVKAWRWLMAMTEHEVHHRSQLATYLSLMGVQPPHIFGLGVEDLIALSVT